MPLRVVALTVSWSSGTGLLGPRDLEFRHHDKLGRLKDDEAVVSKK